MALLSLYFKLTISLFSLLLIFLSFFLPLFINPIYSILCFLFLCFLIAVILFYLNIYYLSLIFLIIYAGAIVVLFLFLLLTTVKNFVIFENREITWPTTLQLVILNLINFFYSKIINSGTLFLESFYFNIGIRPMTTLNYNLQYFSNDLSIISDNIFTNHFIILHVTIVTLLFSLIYSIVVVKSTNLFLNDKKLKKYI